MGFAEMMTSLLTAIFTVIFEYYIFKKLITYSIDYFFKAKENDAIKKRLYQEYGNSEKK